VLVRYLMVQNHKELLQIIDQDMYRCTVTAPLMIFIQARLLSS
jgi:hypothetical protein